MRLVAAGIVLLLGSGPSLALNIGPLLETCPQFDPAYAQIRSDFEIRRNGVVVQDIPCSEPIPQLPIAEYTDELIVLQGLRAVFHMDLGSTTLPWTAGTLYEWMKSKMTGIDISDTAAVSSCCETLDGKTFFVVAAQDDFNRGFDRGWKGISGNIDLYAHELRHLDGFPHVSCCGINDGCDQTYDESNLSPYGIQWWLNVHWVTGELYVGFSCLDPSQIVDIRDWHLSAADGFTSRFCDNKPPILDPPPTPGGVCRPDCGDVTGEGAVNIGDALAVAQYDVGLRQCSEFTEALGCDVNGDGACDIGDALKMAQCDVGLVSCAFTCSPFGCP